MCKPTPGRRFNDDKRELRCELRVAECNQSPLQACELCWTYTREPACGRCNMLVCADCWANWADSTRMPCLCQLAIGGTPGRLSDMRVLHSYRCTLIAIRSRFVSERGWFSARSRTQTPVNSAAMPPNKGRWGQGTVPAAVYKASPAPSGKGSQSPVTPEWPGKGKSTKGLGGPVPPKPAQSGDCRNYVSDGGAVRATGTGKGKTSSAGGALRATDAVPAGGAVRASGAGKGKPSAAGKASAGLPSGSVGGAMRASGSATGDSQLRPPSQAVPEPSYQQE